MKALPRDIVHGIEAGLLAGTVQVAIGKAEEIALQLPPHESADIAPRFMRRVANAMGTDLSPVTRWLLGTAFHYGLAATWGAIYAIAYERRPLRPVLAGALLGGLIYGTTFPRWGAAVLSRTERPPERRTRRMSLVDLSVAMSFGFATALIYDRIQRR